MRDLPLHCVAQIKPFERSGIDYADPFEVKAAVLRKIKEAEAFICIFVCMVTTAVHIEIVSNLSTSLFVVTLNCFLNRTCKCTDIFSDCGNNFVEAQRYLKEIDTILRDYKCIHNTVKHPN